MRNIVVDDELDGADRVISYGVAVAFLVAALCVGISLRTDARWGGTALLVLVTLGVLRWTIRGPIILVSDEWEIGFKVVHTILWLVTVLLSALSWREHARAEVR